MGLPKRQLVLGIAMSFLGFGLQAQVGINTTEPNNKAVLDISATLKAGGLLLPQVELIQTTNHAPLTSHVAGMLVYNTSQINDVEKGMYYNDGSQWVLMERAGKYWHTEGNAAIDPDVNFLGTTDDNPVSIHLNNIPMFEFTSNDTDNDGSLLAYIRGNAARPTYSWGSENGETIGLFAVNDNRFGFATEGIERMRLLDNGRLMINRTSAYRGRTLSVEGSPEGSVITGRSVNGAGITGQEAKNGVVGSSDHEDYLGVFGSNANSNGTGVKAAGNNQAVYNYAPGAGLTASGDTGVYAIAHDSKGIGVIAIGNDLDMNEIVVPEKGSGITAIGKYNGAFTYSNTKAQGISSTRNHSAGTIYYRDVGANLRIENNIANMRIRRETILFFTFVFRSYFGTRIQRYLPDGLRETRLAHRYNAEDDGGVGGIYIPFNPLYQGTEDHMIKGDGVASTIIRDPKNEKRILFVPEAPEAMYKDYGMGQLQNGQAYIELDPILKQAIHVDDKHPLRVFITLEGECNGIYVTKKTADGFFVKELNNGRSNVSFAWKILANRADNFTPDGYSRRLPVSLED